MKPMPSSAPSSKIALLACSVTEYWAGSPQELLTMLARCLLTISASASSRSASVQLPAATYRTLASGASPCTDSTSRVSSPYQPGASHWFGPASVYGPALNCLYWPGLNGWSPVAVAYWLASDRMVGEA